MRVLARSPPRDRSFPFERSYPKTGTPLFGAMLGDPIWLIKWEENHRMQSGISPRRSEEDFDARRMAGRRQELQQTVARDRRRRRIHQRMKIKRLMG